MFAALGAQCAQLARGGIVALTMVIVVGVLSGCKNDNSSWPSPIEAVLSRPQSTSATSPPPAQVELTSLAVGPPDTSVVVGSNSQFTATALYSDGSRKDVTGVASWASSNANVASFQGGGASAGLASTLGPGSTQISASLAGVQGATSLTVTAATLVSISVIAATSTVPKGTHLSLRAIGLYSNGSQQDVTSLATWRSSSSSVVSVSLSGQATALNPGSTVVTADWKGVEGAVTLAVTPAALTSLQVTPAAGSIAKGTQESLVATGVYSDGSTLDITGVVSWISSDGTIASVGAGPGGKAVATALSPGSVKITASLVGVSGSTALTVTAASLVSLEVSPGNASVANGLTVTFVATGVYTDHSTQDLTRTAVWSTSDPSVAAISNASGYEGLGTTLKTGAVTITATVGKVSGSTTLTVTSASLVSIGVTPANPSIANGTRQQFTATGVYTDGSTQNLTSTVTWQPAAGAIASISSASGSNGLATSVGIGSTTITATLGSVSGSATLTVTAATLVSIGVTPTNPSVANGTRQQFTATGVYTDGSSQDLTSLVSWQSTDVAVASIGNASGSNGLATSVGVGTTTISATFSPVVGSTVPGATPPGTVSGSTTLTVTAATLVSIGVTPVNPSIASGTGKQFVATGVYTDGSTHDLTSTVTWQSTNLSAATISNAAATHGMATSVGVGTTTISATLGSVSGSTLLTVTGVSLVSISVTPANPTITNGTAQQFIATATYSNGSTASVTGTVTWSSTNQAVAPVSNAAGSNGVASAIGVGSTQISASSNGVVSPAVTLTVSASSAYVYTVNQADNDLSEYTIGSGGVLTAVLPVSTVSTGLTPSAIAIDPSGRYVYVSNQDSNTVSQYVVGTGGALTSIGTVPTGNLPVAAATDPSGRYVYVLNNLDGTISEYSIGSTGALTQFGTASAGAGPFTIVVDPTGRYVYVTDIAETSVYQYKIGTGGALTPIGTPVTTGSNPIAIVVDPTGRWVYVTDQLSFQISQYSIGTGGGLTPIGSGVVSAGQYPQKVAVDPSGHHAYAVNMNDNSISEYAIGADGSLTQFGLATTGSTPTSITVDPAGRYLYVTNSDSTISQYSIDGVGNLTAIASSITAGNGPIAIVSAN